jgi:SpoVK/Ycf46/Vps4 family AAA+-type ATPase
VGKGLHALFSGPSGTGKTMAAEIMARELGLELHKIDLSGVVSKYIGETEKNLARIFAEAEATSAILFFDEADALFGKRSDVKDAHDRYANIETSFLLQRMEEYEGVTILATNLRRNLDEAFSRRLAFVVQFPFPEVAERLLIWQGVFPAFLAATAGETVSMAHLVRATKRELQKAGRAHVNAEFGEYSAMLEPE